MPHFITTHSINNPNYIKMQQNKNQQLDAKFRKFIKVLIMAQIQNFGFKTLVQILPRVTRTIASRESIIPGFGFSCNSNFPCSTYVYVSIIFSLLINGSISLQR